MAHETIRQVSWEYFDSMIKKLYANVSDYDFNMILTVQRGGLVPATCISHLSGVRDIGIMYGQHSESDEIRPGWKKDMDFDPLGVQVFKKRILFIDDIVGTGKTLEMVSEYCAINGAESFKSACLFLNSERYNGKHKPDYIVEQITEWIQFPWEKR